MSTLLKQFQDSSSLYGSNANFIEDLYEQYLENPDSVTESWRLQFSKMQLNGFHDTPHSPIVERFANLAVTPGRLAKLQGFTEESVKKQSAVARLINHYRVRGHQLAKNNPLGKPNQEIHDLEPSYYGLSEPDMDTLFYTDLLYGVNKRTLRDIIATLQQIYCGSIGCEFMHIVNTEIRRWFLNRLENEHITHHFDADSQRALLKQLTAAEGIERYLHQRFVGQKRFSLEGAEALIPILNNLIQRGGEKQVKEMVIGMAHRGRLNVLVNILGKSPSILFDEFQGMHINTPGVSSGDVKYHMGFSSDIDTAGGPIHVTLAFNPSHLEIINPVVEGSVKARQDRRGKKCFNSVIPILIHGDAAFAGQGIVMETLNMSETRAFHTGGTIHVIINNQIGFTTSNPADARSTLYCSDVASMIQAPVFHVNGDDPEAVIYVTQLAMDYRMAFNKDVVIDLLCYRRLGHNEADEPATTQPMMYKIIRDHPTTRHLYADKLILENVLTTQEVVAMDKRYQALLDEGEVVCEHVLSTVSYSYSQAWHQYQDQHWTCAFDGRVDLEHLRFCSERLLHLPADFELHPRVAKIMESRGKMAAGALPLDWGFAENLSYATLLMKNYNLRLTGQDVGRGTFFHRHAILHNQLNGKVHVPLRHLSEQQGEPQIFDSLLSEAGVLGFEYGYSTTSPESLIIWEAQFGDFANGAQVVIDQFISSGGTKWGRLSGLVMLLPHGYEGQGPEHSSARLERYLQLCAEHNIQVCTPTTPAQIFHLLRRQLLRPYRKPLVIMSPKSLLRHKLAVSTLEELTEAQFQPIIGEIDAIDLTKVTRLILCAGKVYYDLLEARRTDNSDHIAIIRIEQLYPFPLNLFKQEIAKFPQLEKVVWCQEEPKNQGAWHQTKHHLFQGFDRDFKLTYAGRAASASPAVGDFSTHIKQQQAVVASALYGNQTGENHAH
ncbi:MAG: 2-oxoglutarate dehydrogenase E1 component [Methylococcaceae bacterium]|nr:2-oxoglutarate dehydrogenase E1 component [Methylococcaceae bacterium]